MYFYVSYKGSLICFRCHWITYQKGLAQAGNMKFRQFCTFGFGNVWGTENDIFGLMKCLHLDEIMPRSLMIFCVFFLTPICEGGLYWSLIESLTNFVCNCWKHNKCKFLYCLYCVTRWSSQDWIHDLNYFSKSSIQINLCPFDSRKISEEIRLTWIELALCRKV